MLPLSFKVRLLLARGFEVKHNPNPQAIHIFASEP